MSATRVPLAIVVMGVSGFGKSTIGAKLAARMDAEFIDADDLHSDASKSKLAVGIALTMRIERHGWRALGR